MEKGSFKIKVGLAEMLKGGVIMDVTNVEQACIAEKAGAVAVMALEKIPADIRRDGGISRMSNPQMIKEIRENVSIPVMAKCRIGHFAEAQILEALEIDFIDESEVLTPADYQYHVDKKQFKVPFVCGARNLGEALRRINEGAAMIRTKGEAGSGNIVEAVKHMRAITDEIKSVSSMKNNELDDFSIANNAPIDFLKMVRETNKLPVPNFSAGGIATPADASLMMQLGAESLFVGSGIFKSEDPEARAEAIVQATTFYDNPKRLAEISSGLKEAMEGLDISDIPDNEMLQNRGW
jgi:pyridoxal 5'-phosphate synthase pdxS subunit